MTIRCLLWDFGNTLADELSLWRESEAWMDVYHSFDEDDGLGMAWCRGDVGLDEFAADVAPRVGLSPAAARAHLLRTDCLRLFPAAHAFFQARHRRQAIVTVNPAMFRGLAEGLGLSSAVETIVVSAEEGTLDKGALCAIALERMGGGLRPEESLLIDNRRDCLAAWAARGGIGHHFTTDDAFAASTRDGLDGLLA